MQAPQNPTPTQPQNPTPTQPQRPTPINPSAYFQDILSMELKNATLRWSHDVGAMLSLPDGESLFIPSEIWEPYLRWKRRASDPSSPAPP